MNNSTLDYLIREPKKPSKKPPLLIMLHGYGSNEADLFSFASDLPDELLIISARAPLSMDYGAYAWYTIRFNEDSANLSDIPEAKKALKKIDLFITEIMNKYEVDINNIFLLGFSQGAILSTAYAINHSNKVQHVVALSGYVNTKLLKDDYKNNNFENLNFFVSHGSDDQVIPVFLARKTPDFLSNLNIKNTYQEYPVGHGVSPQNFSDFNVWISERL